VSRWPVAALYVEADGPYADLAAEVYDAERDARTYTGDLPVVAHPPCGPWGKLSWSCRHQNPDAGPHAVAEVRRCGGILEHPVGSRLFEHCGILVGDWSWPWRPTDPWGGYTIRIPQWHWGHRGAKDTILYIVGTADLPPLPARGCVTEPYPVQNMSSRARRLTPPAMAWWMAAAAARCTPPRQPASIGSVGESSSCTRRPP